MLVVVVAVAVAGGVLLRDVYQRGVPGEVKPVTAPEASSLAPHEQPGSPLVQLTPDASDHPRDEIVRRLLQAYFDGINGRNYDRWKTSVTSERVRAKPEETWLRDYRSTKDGSILVHRIDTARDGKMNVLLSFTSTQDLRDAPVILQERCIRWWLALPVAVERGHWKIDTVPAGTIPEMAKC